MRIKKKDVILEAQLIDVTTEFTAQEKKILKTLFQLIAVPKEDVFGCLTG